MNIAVFISVIMKSFIKTLVHNEIREQPVLLIGVTFALLDFAEKYSIELSHTIVMETGGMKGRREEITREEVHAFFKEKLGLPIYILNME